MTSKNEITEPQSSTRDPSILDARAAGTGEGGPSFVLKHRLFRVIWNIVWLGLASWTPAPLHRWRIMLLRLFGARVSSTAFVYGSVRVWYPPNLTMDDFACLGPHVNCYAMAPIHIGNHAVVSQGAHLCAGMHDIEDTHFQLNARPIIIGAHAWIAAEAFVGPGVTIGEGAVLGARGVAFGDMAPWSVNVGNPARTIRSRGQHVRTSSGKNAGAEDAEQS